MKRLLLIVAIGLLTSIAALGQANPVTYSPVAGTYTSTQSVTLSTTTTGTIIFYTTDGSTPDISSTQYAGPITVSATTTIKAIAAVVGVNRTNVQNNNPNVGGTYWKKAQCQSFGGWSSTTAYAVGAHVNQGGSNWVAIAAGTNHTPSSSPIFWSNYNSTCAADNPGGSGVSNVATVHTSGNATPSLTGASMAFGMTSAPSAQTNTLWPPQSPFGSSDGASQYYEDHWYYWPSPNNASSDEDDDFSFNHTTGFRYMYGTQYCFGTGCPGGSSGWDFGGNSNVPWSPSGVSAGGTFNTWHHFQKLTHRVPAEETSKPCTSAGNWPYLYFDKLIIDGVPFTNGGPGWKYCANSSTFGSLSGLQAQIDIGPHASATAYTNYWDKANFLSTFAPSSPTTGAFVIMSGPAGPPIHVSGVAKFSGGGVTLK